jgi:hypothetical protein
VRSVQEPKCDTNEKLCVTFVDLLVQNSIFLKGLCTKMFGKFLCQSLFSSPGLASASLAHLWVLFGKDMSQKNEVLFDKQQVRSLF